MNSGERGDHLLWSPVVDGSLWNGPVRKDVQQNHCWELLISLLSTCSPYMTSYINMFPSLVSSLCMLILLNSGTVVIIVSLRSSSDSFMSDFLCEHICGTGVTFDYRTMSVADTVCFFIPVHQWSKWRRETNEMKYHAYSHAHFYTIWMTSQPTMHVSGRGRKSQKKKKKEKKKSHTCWQNMLTVHRNTPTEI